MTYEQATSEWNKYIRCQEKGKSKECYLEYGFDCDKCGDEMEISIDLIRTSVEALEKQIPKKPELWHNQPYPPEWADDDWGYRCPTCGNEDIDYPEHHCSCGQALDWSDDEYEAYQDEMGGIAEVVASEVE